MSRLHPKPKELTSFTPVTKWLEHVCPTCGRHFWRRPSYKAKNKIYKHFYCSLECTKPKYKTGRTIEKKTGYIMVKVRGHPYSHHNNYIYEHRLVMEKVLGRYLEPYEYVHHVNGIRDDNRPKNLELRVRGNHPKGVSTSDMVKILRQLGYTVSPPLDSDNQLNYEHG